MSVVRIDPAGRRAMDRDYLDADRRSMARSNISNVVNFKSRLEQDTCVACGKAGHRASKCKQA
jgi:hypothetical protein